MKHPAPYSRSPARTRFDEPDDDTEDDLWFLPGPIEEDAPDLSPLPRGEPSERAQIDDWTKAEAGQAARLAQVAMRFGALDDRLTRGPQGWKHRLAMVEAARLSWLTGDRVSADRLGLWASMRISAASSDTAALQRAAWALRRLTGGPGPGGDLADFLGRHDGEGALNDRLAAWRDVMDHAAHLHPITGACLGLRLWRLAGTGAEDELLEGAVIAMRLAAGPARGAVFAPVATGGGFLRSGDPGDLLEHWLDAMDQAILAAMRVLDRIEMWEHKAQEATRRLSGRTPPLLIAAFRDWPHLSTPMAERLTGASRAATQRNLAWMQDRGLIVEVTGQGRFRMWRAAD